MRNGCLFPRLHAIGIHNRRSFDTKEPFSTPAVVVCCASMRCADVAIIQLDHALAPGLVRKEAPAWLQLSVKQPTNATKASSRLQHELIPQEIPKWGSQPNAIETFAGTISRCSIDMAACDVSCTECARSPWLSSNELASCATTGHKIGGVLVVGAVNTVKLSLRTHKELRSIVFGAPKGILHGAPDDERLGQSRQHS